MDEGFPGPSMRPASHKERAPINNIWSNVRMLRTMISTELVVLVSCWHDEVLPPISLAWIECRQEALGFGDKTIL